MNFVLDVSLGFHTITIGDDPYPATLRVNHGFAVYAVKIAGTMMRHHQLEAYDIITRASGEPADVYHLTAEGVYHLDGCSSMFAGSQYNTRGGTYLHVAAKGISYIPRSTAEQLLGVEAARDKAGDEARADAVAQGMHPLKGTPRQVRWAETLRLKAVAQVQELLNGAADEMAFVWAAALEALRVERQAKFFIESRTWREYDYEQWARKAAKKAGS